MQNEIWKQIAGYKNYSVSSCGKVRNDTARNAVTPFDNGAGYQRVTFVKDKKRKILYVHRLVAIQFLDNPDEKPCVDHIDQNTKNNKVSNLRWATKSENARNSKICSTNTSGTKGVCWEKKKEKKERNK